MGRKLGPDKSRNRTNAVLELQMSGNGCQLRWSMQHLRAVYSLEFRIPMSFWVADSSAARHGRAALAKNQTSRCLAGSIAAGADWCFRCCRVAKDFVDRRSRLAHSWPP